jgi:hypothetical protein
MWFLRRRLLNDPSLFLHFLDYMYLPFEEDMVTYFSNFEFPLPDDDFYQVGLKLACYFRRRKFLKILTVPFPLLSLSLGVAPRLNNFECPFLKDDLSKLSLKLV